MTFHHRITRPYLQLAALTVAIMVSSCAVPSRPQPSPQVTDELHKIDPSQIPLSEFGQLPVFITSQMTDGRNLHLRGLVGNPYPETVEGVRVVLRMLSEPGEGARELDRVQKVLEDQLATGQQTALRLDVQTMYAMQGGGFRLQAFAIKRGGQDLPPPPDWRESR